MKNQALTLVLLTSATLLSFNVSSQNDRKDKGEFNSTTSDFYNEMKKANQAFFQEKPEQQKPFTMNYAGIDVPKSASEFKTVWAGNPVSQGETGTCWCFSTTSFYESEIYRITKQEIRLSELYTVYWQYVEKAREFVNTRGKSAFGEGSETNAVAAMMKKYGQVPYEAYSGMVPGRKFHDHGRMFTEMNAYLQGIKTANAWNEQEVTSTIKSIMNFYIGVPPTTFTYKGKSMSPIDFLKNVTKLNPDDYVDFMSLMERSYWSQSEYKVQDNWWRSADYYNIPLDDFMNSIKAAIKAGYSMSIGGDVSESGINSKLGVAMVPTYDIPSAYIDENARQFRFSNQTTTDDHALHLVGWLEKPNGTWYLIKDSGAGSRNNTNSPGYYYYHEDFVKLKMMTFTIHKDAMKDILTKFIKK